MSGSSLPIGDYSNSSLSTHKLSVYSSNVTHDTIIQPHEIELLKGLVLENPTQFSGGVEEVVSDTLNNHIMVHSESNDSNIALTIEFKSTTDVNYQNSDYNEKQNLVKTNVPNFYTQQVSLGDNTAPLYNGNLKFEYSDGDSTYYSSEDHYISFETSDNDYTLQKGMNSVLSNTDTNPTNGIQGSFNNSFNQINAFFTENILERNSVDNSVNVKSTGVQTLGAEGITTSVGVAGDLNWEKLEATIVSSTEYPDNHPLFGALQFVQDSLQINFSVIDNNLTSDSTLSKLLNSTNITTTQQSSATIQPDSSLSETQFQELFTPADLAKVGPGYDFKLNIDLNNNDGYSLDTTNNILIPNYNSNNQINNSSAPTSMFTIDDSQILENVRYMSEMKSNSYFNNDSHKLYVKNGNLVKDTNNSSNLNFDKFNILDGVEQLTVTTNYDVSDLKQKGIVNVKDTNNTLGDDYARYRKYIDNTYNTTTTANSRPNKLVVQYSESEPNYISSTGTIDDLFKNNYHVQSEINTLNNSTNSLSNANVWSPTLFTNKNAARANNSALVFQNLPDSILFDSTNISEYEATGLDNNITTDKFALISLNKSLSFEDSDESPLFKTSDNATIQNVVSNVSITNIDLIQFGSQDMRVLINGKKASDMPLPSNSWQWATGNDTTGELNSYNDDSNNGYVVSEKASIDYLGNKIYDVLQLAPNDTIAVEFKLLTDNFSLPSKDILSRKAEVIITYGGSPLTTITERIENDDKDLTFFNISESTDAGTVQSLAGLNQPTYYEVKKYITTKEYHVAIKNRVGPYKNLWIVKQVKEFTEWYQLTNQNKNGQIMPDYYLMNIKNQGAQVFQATRTFENGQDKVSSLSSVVNLNVKDLMGFTASVQYNNGTSWLPFTLKSDPLYGYSLDPMYDKDTVVTLMNPNNLTTELATMKITVDSPLFTSLGLNSHVSPTDNLTNAMYIINLSVPRGSNSFSIKGYNYSYATDSQYFNKTTTWNPYANGDNLFLASTNGILQGMQMPNLSTLVELIDPTPGNTTDVNEVNKIKVTVKQGDIQLFSFVSNKYILENFNVIYMPQVIVQHDYIVDNLAYTTTTPILSGTEYLASTYVSNSLDIVNLPFGSNKKGIRVEVEPASTINGALADDRLSTSYFRLAGDKVQIKPIDETVNTNIANKYIGRYAEINGEEIMPSASGFQLPTNSLVHRNIHPTIFRGLQNGQSTIDILRTETTVKMVIGDKFVDDMNIFNDSNISSVWTNRTQFNGVEGRLRAMKMIKGTFTQPELENMAFNSLPVGSNIEGIGLIVIPQFSMFPQSVSSTLHKINVLLSPSSYTKTIVNPLDPSINVTVNSNLFEYTLHQFKDFALVASRIKVYINEKYNFKYTIPDLKVYHSAQYIGDPSLTDWSLIQPKTDDQLRTGVIIGNATHSGVVLFKRLQTFVSSFKKYCILPRPTAKLESYNVTNLLAPLPDNFTTKSYQRVSYHVDINITTTNDFSQGAGVTVQNHRPFNKNPSVGVSNQLNAVLSNVGVNNIKLGFNVAKYLYFREQTIPSFSFTMASNKLKISNGVGLTANVGNNYTEIFNGYISELADQTKWHQELIANMSNTFNVTKKWELNIAQLLYPVEQFLVLNPSTLADKCIIVNGITSFGMDSYNLDLQLLDSVKIRYYRANYVYNSTSDTQKVVFYRYATIEGLPWITTNDFSKSSMFKPLISTKDMCEMSISISNILNAIPYNVDSLIKAAIISSDFTDLTWVPVTSFTDIKSKISFTTLSTKGAGSLLEILQVTKEHPFKVLTSKRPYILDVKRADGSRAFAINYDGKLLSHKLITYQIELLPKVEYGTNILPQLNCGGYYEHHIQPDSEF